MQYVKIVLHTNDTELRDMLMANLAETGFEGFEEREEELIAYIPQASFDEETLKMGLEASGTEYAIEVIPEQNWNAQWEANFQPVVVEDFCTIRAHFHTLPIDTRLEIVITPKMSFGTGHHATTQLMMLQMRDMDMAGQTALDFGTGTGILAILAEKLGATAIIAIDNDEWSYENAKENVSENDCKNISVSLASEIGEAYKDFDIILANINRHILLEHMTLLYSKINNGGKLLISGLLNEDETIIVAAAELVGFTMLKTTELNSWIALLFEKI